MEKADFIFTGRAVFTGLDSEPFDGGVAVKENRILRVFRGNIPEAITGEKTQIEDVGNRLIMPSFIDAHTHFSLAAASESSHVCTGIERSRSPRHCVEILKEYEKSHPFEERIMGIGWYPANWGDVPLPDKSLLDQAFSDKPVYLLCADLHTAWVNGKALQELGIDENTTPEYGRVRLGKDGKPDGILFEMDLILPIFSRMTDYPVETLSRMLSSFMRKANSFGITALSDMTPSKPDTMFLSYMEKLKWMEDSGLLTARLHMYTNLGTTGEYSREKKLAAAYDSEKLRYCGLKQMIDGVTSTYTGLLLEPYSDRPSMTCSPNYPKEIFMRCTEAALREGLGIRYHCIGDKAVRWALDCFESAQKKTALRPVQTIEHIESIHPDDIGRFGTLGVIASVQPYHLTLDQNEKVSRIGPERCRYEWPFRSLADRGAVLAFGTDAPVIGLNPFVNIHAAVTRRDDREIPTGMNPEEKITLAEALTAYTRGAASAYGRNDVGVLKEGALADLLVTDRNLFQIPQEELKHSRADLTMFDGKIVFERI